MRFALKTGESVKEVSDEGSGPDCLIKAHLKHHRYCLLGGEEKGQEFIIIGDKYRSG